MSDQREGGITWTDATWNPIRGCSRVSEGCRNCYAERQAFRYSGPGMAYEGLVRVNHVGIRQPQWNGTVRVVEEHMLDPLRWRRPRRIFVNSMSDLFHPNVADETIDRIFAVMALCPQHTFQVLTKRPERMLRYLTPPGRVHPVWTRMGGEWPLRDGSAQPPWPLPNVWLGVSVEHRVHRDARQRGRRAEDRRHRARADGRILRSLRTHQVCAAPSGMRSDGAAHDAQRRSDGVVAEARSGEQRSAPRLREGLCVPAALGRVRADADHAACRGSEAEQELTGFPPAEGSMGGDGCGGISGWPPGLPPRYMRSVDMENDLPSIVVKAGQGDLVAQYLIEYDEEARVLIVDGVRVSTELFRAMVVLPCAQCWLRFERKGDEVTVHQWKQPPPGTQQ